MYFINFQLYLHKLSYEVGIIAPFDQRRNWSSEKSGICPRLHRGPLYISKGMYSPQIGGTQSSQLFTGFTRDGTEN